MQIRRCPDCGGRLVAEIMEGEVAVKCNACGQELGTFANADMYRKLKPCPRCGYLKPELRQPHWIPYEWYVMCPNCEFGDDCRYPTSAEALTEWEKEAMQ